MKHGPASVYILGTIFLFAAAAGAAPINDTIALKTGQPVTGTFQAFKNGRFYFQPADGGKQMREMRTRIAHVTATPPAKVSVKPVGKSKMDGLFFKTYDGRNFTFTQNGKDLVLSGMKVSMVEVALDFGRSERGPATLNKPGGGAVDIAASLAAGKPAIVHFHKDGIVASMRQGNYVAALARDSKGRLDLIKIDISDADDPTAAKYRITSLPQFWFYNGKGKLAAKLVDRFTSDDIDAALKRAMQQ